MLLKTGPCFTAELENNCPTIVACVAALPVGAPAVAGDLVLGPDNQYHALPATVAPNGSETKVTAGANTTVTGAGTVASPYVVSSTATAASTPFATPAETIAGLVTGKAVDPADLTAKLANQPAAGACTDREEVVWNGTILQGAAKHHSFSGNFLTAYLAQAAGSVYAPVSADTAITNPSACRVLRVTIRDLSSRMQSDSATVSGNLIQGMSITVGSAGVQYAIGAERSAGVKEIHHSGSDSVGYGPASGFYDIPPGGSATFTVSEYLVAGGISFIASAVHGASASFIAQTL